MAKPSEDPIRALFLELIDLDPAERAKRLDSVDPETGAAVAELLGFAATPDPRLLGFDVLDAAAKSFHDTEPGRQRLPTSIGPYRVLGLLGQGGMGVVYRAEQRDPRRMVALKIVGLHFFGAHYERRLRQEAEILALLQHPGIAQVYATGVADTELGEQPYFAMELINGLPITEWARERKLPLERRIELIAMVCDAVQHAHERGIIHRDLKPANILVSAPATTSGEAGGAQPKVLDFGVARTVDPEATWRNSMQTKSGQLIGTLAYMSPEQIRGQGGNVDVRSDIYSLGVLLYEIVSGKLPIDLVNQPIGVITQWIAEKTPKPLRLLDRAWGGDLTTIAATALRKEPHERYPSATALADDLRRWLRNETILARPATAFYQLRMFARRYRALVAGVIASVIALTIGLMVTLFYALDNARLLHRESTLLVRETQLRKQEAESRRSADALAAKLRVELYRSDMRHGGSLLRSRSGQSLLRTKLSTWQPRFGEPSQPDLRGWEWRLLHAHAWSRLGAKLPLPPESQIYSWCWNAEGGVQICLRTWATKRHSTSVNLFDPATGSLLSRRPLGDAGSLSPDGRRLVEFGRDETRLRETATGRQLASWQPAMHHKSATWSPDGRFFAAVVSPRSRPDGTAAVSIRDMQSGGTEVVRLAARSVAERGQFAFSPDGSRLAIDPATGRERRKIHVYHTKGWQRERVLTIPSPLATLEWHPSKPWLTTLLADGSILVHRLEKGGNPYIRKPDDERVTALRWRPDGHTLAVGGISGSVRMLHHEAGRWADRPPEFLGAQDVTIRRLLWSPDGRHLASSGNVDVQLWEVDESAALRTLVDPAQHRGKGGRALPPLAWHPDGKRLLDGQSRIVNAETGEIIEELPGYAAAWSHDGELLAFRCFQTRARPGEPGRESSLVAVRRDGETHRLHQFDVGGKSKGRLTWHPSEPTLAVSTAQSLAIWQLGIGSRRCDIGPHRDLFWQPDGTRLLVSRWRNSITPLDPKTMMVAPDMMMETEALDTDFHPLDGRLALARRDRIVAVHAPGKSLGTALMKLSGHAGEVLSVAWSPDGARLASGGRDRVVRIWDVEGRAEVLTLPHRSDVVAVAWSPDGRALASQTADGCLRVWDSESRVSRESAVRGRDR